MIVRFMQRKISEILHQSLTGRGWIRRERASDFIKMPCCCVTVCKNQSKYVNYNNRGVTYHLFPSEPKRKNKWINACGKGPNWFPAKTSVICSDHFEENCFQPLKRRRLYDWAVPSKKLRVVYAPMSENSLENEPGWMSRTSNEERQATNPRRTSDEKPARIKKEDSDDENTSDDDETKPEELIIEEVYVKSGNQKPKDGPRKKRARQDIDDTDSDYSEEIYEFGKFVAEQLLCLNVEDAKIAQKEIKKILQTMTKTNKTRRKPKPSNQSPSKEKPKAKSPTRVVSKAVKKPLVAKTQSNVNSIRPVVQLVFPQVNILGKTGSQLKTKSSATPVVNSSSKLNNESSRIQSGLESSLKEIAVVNLDNIGPTSAPINYVVVPTVTDRVATPIENILEPSKDTRISVVAQDPEHMVFDEIPIKIEPVDADRMPDRERIVVFDYDTEHRDDET